MCIIAGRVSCAVSSIIKEKEEEDLACIRFCE